MRVVITENLRNFLALPMLPETVAVFGGGNALSLLARSQWLAESAVHYWGDIDAHGFLMLSRLREFYQQTLSIMMDATTLDVGRDLLGTGAPATFPLPPALTPEEASLFEETRSDTTRLEQERLPYEFVVARLRSVLANEV